MRHQLSSASSGFSDDVSVSTEIHDFVFKVSINLSKILSH